MGALEQDEGDEPRRPEVTRRGLIATAGAGAAAVAAGQLEIGEAAAVRPPRRPGTPAEAFNALMAGNGRYVRGRIQRVDYNRLGERIAQTQKPIAAIITCADSRLSPSVIFDVGLGNLFVSRVAGNSVEPGTLGSTEYAVAALGVHLIMVLGHSDCGAIRAALKVVNGTKRFPQAKYGSIGRVVDQLVGPIRALPRSSRTVNRSIAVNARAQAQRIAGRGPIIKQAVAAGRVGVVAAVYDIRSGRVSTV